MSWFRSDLKMKAKEVMKTAYWKLVLVGLVLGVCTGGASGGSAGRSASQNEDVANAFSEMDPAMIIAIIGIVVAAVLFALVFGVIISTFLLNPLQVGCRKFTVDVRENPGTSLSEMGFVFTNNYGNVVKTMFLMGLYLSLWSLLLVIPGIIKGYEYRMIPYLLAEDPSLSTAECFAKSREMMMGEKWKTFVLDLSFIGWYILGIFTCGILYIFYVNPYVNQTNAELYAVLKQKVAPVQPVDTTTVW